MDTLPADCWAEVFAHLPPWYRAPISQVCRLFRDVAKLARFDPHILLHMSVYDEGQPYLQLLPFRDLHDSSCWTPLVLEQAQKREYCYYHGRVYYLALQTTPTRVHKIGCYDLLTKNTVLFAVDDDFDSLQCFVVDEDSIWCVIDHRTTVLRYDRRTGRKLDTISTPELSYVFSHGGRLYGTAAGIHAIGVRQYDQHTNTWLKLSELREHVRSGARYCYSNGYIYQGGGWAPGDANRSLVHRYDIERDCWERLPDKDCVRSVLVVDSTLCATTFATENSAAFRRSGSLFVMSMKSGVERAWVNTTIDCVFACAVE